MYKGDSRITYHPVASFVCFVRHQIRKDSNGLIILPGLNVACQLVQFLNRIGLEKIFVVEVIEQNVKSLLSVYYVLLVLCWRFGLDALHVCVKHFVNPAGSVRDV